MLGCTEVSLRGRAQGGCLRAAEEINLESLTPDPAQTPCEARVPTVGAAGDLCFLTATPLGGLDRPSDRITGIAIEQGPVERTGAQGPILSIIAAIPTAR